MLKIPSSLPWKWIGLAVAALVAIATIVTGVNIALSRAKQAGKDEVQAQWNAEKAGRAQASADLTAALSDSLGALDTSLQGALASTAAQGRTITNTIQKETIREPRYISADCSVTPGVFDQINAARGLSAPAPAASGSERGMPVSESADEPNSGSSGSGGL
jgi:hypothetical protein